ncbi:hypothetical protein [Shouchella patagoniensis]|uniref:hypothetical protein n=1 Tax=Shouchella patagoniensis TaxID=228576 RepID=UPI0009955374|nr:hypothetical protein [Shouchella patagoniensis]
MTKSTPFHKVKLSARSRLKREDLSFEERLFLQFILTSNDSQVERAMNENASYRDFFRELNDNLH